MDETIRRYMSADPEMYRDELRSPVSKALPLLNSFRSYCLAHPEQRFWQALRNWAGLAFVVAIPRDGCLDIVRLFEEARENDLGDMRDTFHWEGRDG